MNSIEEVFLEHNKDIEDTEDQWKNIKFEVSIGSLINKHDWVVLSWKGVKTQKTRKFIWKFITKFSK